VSRVSGFHLCSFVLELTLQDCSGGESRWQQVGGLNTMSPAPEVDVLSYVPS